MTTLSRGAYRYGNPEMGLGHLIQTLDHHYSALVPVDWLNDVAECTTALIRVYPRSMKGFNHYESPINKSFLSNHMLVDPFVAASCVRPGPHPYPAPSADPDSGGSDYTHSHHAPAVPGRDRASPLPATVRAPGGPRRV